jgi:ppGpp synthetase/RelA/SpoT-type nucleotidyltranferase
MPDKAVLTPEVHKQQIDAFGKIRPQYEIYAKALQRVLERACQASFPDALVQSRAKTVSSFAEKVVRKFDKYPDAVNQLKDFCGARVIVQTAEQVRGVRNFIEANFEILESEDKGLLLSIDKFGYRDMHYIVKLRPNRALALGFLVDELADIGSRCAEIQVRTWLEHAWADTLHDRIYKNELKLSQDNLRTGALLAALMEQGDRSFNLLADNLDGLITNYTALASKDDVAKEISIQQLILDNEVEPEKKSALALKLAHLVGASGDRRHVVDLLTPYVDVDDGNRCELLLELGHNLCCVERERPASPGYLRGIGYLKDAVRICEDPEVAFVPHLRKRQSLHARAVVRLARALTAVPGEEHEARTFFRLAHELEPADPYYLSAMLGFELHFENRGGLPASMATTIREAVRVCREHSVAGIELPHAYFSAGRLSLLLDQGYDALGYYALGMRYCLGGVYHVPEDALAEEERWIRGIYPGVKVSPESQRVIDLLKLGDRVAGNAQIAKGASDWRQPVLILTGGAVSLPPELIRKTRDLLEQSCGDFRGTIVSGGTTAGVPGCIGDLARKLADKGKKHFRLVGYLPTRLPHSQSAHAAYDDKVEFGDDFLPDQILRNWSDLLAAGIKPADVLVLGFGGGRLSAVEYRIALGLGAQVGIVTGTGGTAEILLADPLWSGLTNLYRLPFDPATVRAFAIRGDHDLAPAMQEEMAKFFHATYVAGSSKRLPPNMRPWDKLEPTYQRANLEQAHYSVEILEAAGFEVVKSRGPEPVSPNFTDKEVEWMAELEHGRWNVERLRNGWRYGKVRDDSRRIHDCLVSWDELSPDTKPYDRDSVRAFPLALAKAGLEIRRREQNHGSADEGTVHPGGRG